MSDVAVKETPFDNNFKKAYAIKVVFAYLLVGLLAGHVTINLQLSMGIFIIYHLWGAFWIKILYQSPNIYSIRVPTTIIDDWIHISLPSTDALKVRKDRVVTSISELSGIRGAQMMVALRVMTATINMLILVAIQSDLHHRKATLFSIQSGADMVPVCLLILAIGFFLTGHFELNMMDGFHAQGHFTGVFLIFVGCFSLGFSLQWNLFSISLIALEFGLCAGWMAYVAKAPKKSNDIKVVTKHSKMCIGLELAIFYATNANLVLTVYSCGQNEGNIFASPFLANY